MSDWRTGYRDERYEFRLLTLGLKPVGVLEGVESCSLSGSLNADVRWGGRLGWSGLNAPDMTSLLVHPWYVVANQDGAVEEWPLCPPCFARTGSVARTDMVPERVDVDLYDVTYSLAKRLRLPGNLTLPDGSNAVDMAASRVASAGMRFAATPSPRTLAAPGNWSPGTSELKVVNDLLAAAGYWSASADYAGVVQLEPYVDPAVRQPAYAFGSGEVSITGDSTLTRDDFDVPNRLTAVARTRGEVPPMVATVTLDDLLPDSPYTRKARGFWVDGEVLKDVDAADAAALTEVATRALLTAARVSDALTIRHAWVPEVRLGSVVTYDGGTWAVQKMSVSLAPGTPVQAEWVRV